MLSIRFPISLRLHSWEREMEKDSERSGGRNSSDDTINDICWTSIYAMGLRSRTAVAKIEVIQGLAVAAVAYLWASASFSLSFSYFNCCSLCGCDSVDELFIDRLCFIISILFAFVLFFICDGLSGIGGCTTCCCKWIAKKSIRNAIVYKFFHKVTEEQ